MTPEWIATQRARLKAEQENALGLANQTAGALKLLDDMEAELAKLATPQEPVEPT